MQWRNRIVFLLIGLSFAYTSIAQNTFRGNDHLLTLPKSYVIQRSTEEITLDGKPLEKAWDRAQWSDEFVDIEGDLKPAPLFQTRFKLLWDKDNLYVYVELEEPNIWAYYDKHDMVVFHENDIELFIDPDRDTHNYYEFEVNAQNTLFDLVLNKPYRNGGKPDIKWNAEGFESAVCIKGTLNNPNDKDEMWSVEMKVPFSSLSTNGEFVQPEDGSLWKLNFSRVQWQTDLVDGKYVKRKNQQTGRDLPENNWVWSPQGVINMHYPERWGLVMFSEKPAGKKVDFNLPADEVLRKYLWEIYYRQQQFRKVHERYATSLNELNIAERGEDAGQSFQLNLKSDSTAYQVTLTAQNGLILVIDQEGLILQATK
ncbi:carbohydrate-binding family 9-like protein [Maribellus sediminis]|uniref:carbohydrate-binding family 9-like protein n=1 Tax=Maribellus sediminis TaxID=2696285 RepID=UPI00142F87E4|nr:carbohydrate-binding family 9-like protein [Maribellus sediminis]